MKPEQIYNIIQKMKDVILPAEYRQKILRWLFDAHEASEKNEALFHLWNETTGSEISDVETQSSLIQVKKKLGISNSPKREKRIFSLYAKYAAVFLFPLISGLIVWLMMKDMNHTTSNMIECFVPNGEKKEILLSDGTLVKLNSGTLFIYPEQFNKEERRVFLSGEAYFDVTKNENNPFVVKTGRLNVQVLGTKFNVNAYPDNLEMTTTLNSGKVKVYRSQEEDSGIIMKTNEKLVYNYEANNFSLTKADANDYSSWTKGEIRFIRRPFSEVLRTLERRYNVRFKTDSQLNLNELYTISFQSNEPIEQVTNILSKLTDTDFSLSGNIIYLFPTQKGGEHP